MSLRSLLAPAAALFLSCYLFAQQEDYVTPLSVDIDSVVVTATAATARTPVTFVNLDREEIQLRNLGQDAPYLLKWTPSVVVSSDAGTGIGYTGIWIRGSDPTRTNVTINGIPYNDSESQGVFWVNLPDFSSSASQIQIQRGVGTSTNGAGAFGASINFSTNQLSEPEGLHVDATVGSFGTLRGSARYSTGLMDNGLKIDARISRTHSEGYVDRARADLTGYYAGVTYATEGGSIWRFNAFGGHEVTYQAWNGVTEAEIEQFGRTYNSVGTEKPGEPYDDEVDDYQQRHYQLHFDREIGGELAVNVSGHYTRGLGFFEQYKADQDYEEYNIVGAVAGAGGDLVRRRWLDNHFYGTVFSLRYTGLDKTSLTLGGAANRYLGGHYGEAIAFEAPVTNFPEDQAPELVDAGSDLPRYYDNDATKSEQSIYLRADRELLPLRARPIIAYADLQVRRVNYEFLGLDNALNRLDQTETLVFINPKAGLLYDFTGGQAYLSVGVARREPNRNDFVDNPAGERPRPERLINTELGLRQQRDRTNLGVNFFHMAYRDQLVLTGELNDVGEYIRANVDRSYRLGVELQAGYQITPRWTAGGNLTLSRNRAVAFTEFLDDFDENFIPLGQVAVDREDTPLAFSPSVTAALQTTYDLLTDNPRHDLAVEFSFKHVGERYVDNSGDPEALLGGYAYVDAQLRYQVGKLRFSVLARNVTDNLYFSNGWSYRYRFAGASTTLQGLYPQAGRNFLASVGVDF